MFSSFFPPLWRGFFLSIFLSQAIYACEVIDDAHNKIHLNKSAKRIISLAPDLTETLFAIGAGKQIVGVISGSDYPSAALKIPQIGSYAGIDLERIIALHPDLIVTWGQSFSRQLNVLKKFGITIYISEPHRLEDIPRTMENLACLTGNETRGREAAQQFSQHLGVIIQHYRAKKAVKVFYQIDHSMMTINKDSWINQVIKLCGGENIFANVNTITPEVGLEAVIAANPDVIITDAINPDWKQKWQDWPQIQAVKNQQLFSINPDLIDRAGPRLLYGTEQICGYLSQR